jgi:hypothetical protein
MITECRNNRFRAIAMEKGFITCDQLAEAITVQICDETEETLPNT